MKTLRLFFVLVALSVGFSGVSHAFLTFSDGPGSRQGGVVDQSYNQNYNHGYGRDGGEYRDGGREYGSNPVYGNQTRRAGYVETGVVVAARPVEVQGRGYGVGTAAGGALGGVAGSNVGGGSGRVVGAIAGALVGAVIGNSVEQRVRSSEGVELIVRLDSGRQIAVVQELDFPYRPGTRVNLISHGNDLRVSPN